jgi:hypothetical protein
VAEKQGDKTAYDNACSVQRADKAEATGTLPDHFETGKDSLRYFRTVGIEMGSTAWRHSGQPAAREANLLILALN